MYAYFDWIHSLVHSIVIKLQTELLNPQSNVVIDSKNLKWVIGSGDSAVIKDINDGNVSWDETSKKTKYTINPTPTVTTSYGCQYVGAETNSTASVRVLGTSRFW